MNVTFYFDPSCPFCWITSRWLLIVSTERDVRIHWKPFSLALKNESLKAEDDPHRESHQAANRVLRVMIAAQSIYGASLLDLYTASGIKHHVGGEAFNDSLISDLLAENSLPADLLKEADQTTYDKQLRDSLKSATKIVGDDVGVPTIVFNNQKGKQQGFFGPVLQELPTMLDALELWDGLSKLATNSSFYELKRSRPDSMPDVASTAKC